MYDLFPNVNDDIGIEVISRLPFTSLLRFRNINKSWCRIIDSPFFRKLHIEKQLSSHNHDDDDPVLLNLIFSVKNQHQSSPCGFQELSIMHLHTHKPYNDFPSYQDFLNNNKIAQSSQPVHGLICFYKAHSNNPIALCNPSLREIKILPSSPSLGFGKRVVGLGYDDLQKDYKIVQFLRDEQFRSYPVAEVYSRKRNTWRVVPLLGAADHKSYCALKPLQHAEPSSGAMAHWRGKVIDGVGTCVDAIFSFDMRSDALKMMKISCGGYSKILKIFAKENSSFTMIAYGSSWRTKMIIWEYKGDQWFKAGKLRPSFHPSVCPVAIWKSNGLILTISFRKKAMLILCDITSGETVKRFEIPLGSDFIQYRGSFISPN